MKQTITQQDPMGCGAACVAFVAGKTYQEVVEVMGRGKARTVGFQLQEMVDALGHFGLKYQFKYVKPKIKPLIYQNGTIVFVKRSPRYPEGHYLVRHNGFWADPWINLVVDKNITHTASGYRQRLPGKAQWTILPIIILAPEL